MTRPPSWKSRIFPLNCNILQSILNTIIIHIENTCVDYIYTRKYLLIYFILILSHLRLPHSGLVHYRPAPPPRTGASGASEHPCSGLVPADNLREVSASQKLAENKKMERYFLLTSLTKTRTVLTKRRFVRAIGSRSNVVRHRPPPCWHVTGTLNSMNFHLSFARCDLMTRHISLNYIRPNVTIIILKCLLLCEIVDIILEIKGEVIFKNLQPWFLADVAFWTFFFFAVTAQHLRVLFSSLP